MNRLRFCAALSLVLAVALSAAATATPKQRPKTDDGPDLPVSCMVARLWASLYTVAELEEMARRNGVVLSPKQRRQARACIAGN
jgi:hypothetical protein